VTLREVDEVFEQREGWDRKLFWHSGPRTRSELTADENALWPRGCARCSYTFAEADPWQIFSESIYRRLDTGEVFRLSRAPIGAMWWLEWMQGLWNPQLGSSPLCVMLPGHHEWIIDSQANNCSMKDDYNQQRHHCWVAHGAPPDVTVDKNGRTCAAGAGSIVVPGYHGFLRGGYLEGC
jgi:hypothetical protein